ncbi:lipopolysaccharide core biosynthesis protein [Vibrio aerogenes CECT 7868]|uniref:Lipopolysaccharide core biosynthesis protein n=1 Tax=Vibrio aerogenes CECT 7868 TaxID=1216006 RepID=A0A1M5ZDQ8_9VIBR|nr:glycosyltransferase family 9 protein [Vibrio aerogenes]SHI22299.1 lipopolysaccharide core biosynthesis protein [Vibrio aerogenes CECT 7868]
MKKILVIRNDKIGDFMLAWPAFAMLKSSLPDCHISALVPEYTAALAHLCPWIDHVLIDPGKRADKREKQALISQIKQHQFDASVNLFSTTYNALLVWKAGIPYRLAPATKVAQVFYNHRIKQKRSLSLKPEYEYNLDLIRAFLADIGAAVVEPTTPYLRFNPVDVAKQRIQFAGESGLSLTKRWLFVHAGSGGSANNLSLQQYAHIIRGMTTDKEVVLTAGPGEEEKARELKSLLAESGVNAFVYDKNDGLVDFSRSIACADVFMAGSTGPLHIAAALDVPTVGFFPAKRSATPLRWRPLNSDGRHIAFAPPPADEKSQQEDMSRIDPDEVLETLNPWIASYLS